ncbi:MAG TPA: apolipoprotein N-acyltransferase, partial [Aliiroseovarius sp.]|nr:apolipoprotein N-acyltransferase [Aliiroseovarius sp.]
MSMHPGEQVFNLKGWPRFFLAVAFGATLGLGQLYLGLEHLAIVALAMGLALVHGAARPGLVGWGFGTGYFAVSLHWIIDPFLVDAAHDAWMAP